MIKYYKQIVSLLLVILLTSTWILPASAAEKEQYAGMKIHFGSSESEDTIHVMNKDGHLYAKLDEVAKLFNYDFAQDTDQGALVDRKDVKAIIFEGGTSIKYINGIWSFSYSLPYPSVKNSNGYWVPFYYTIRMLNSECLIKNYNSIFISAPRQTLMDAFNECVRVQESKIHYNLLDELGTSDFVIANNHNILMFDKLLKADSSGWGELFTEYSSDKSAFSTKYGDDYSTLFCTQSAEEARDAAETAQNLYNLVSDSGSLSQNLKDIDKIKDTNVGYWSCLINSLKTSVGNADSAKALTLNRAYQSLDQAAKSQDFWNAMSKPIENFQSVFKSSDQASKALSAFNMIFEAWTYWHEFQQQQPEGLNAFKDFSNYLSKNNHSLPDNSVKAINNYVNISSKGKESIIQYSAFKTFKNNMGSIALDAGNLSQKLFGASGCLALTLWDIGSNQIPFIKNGLDSADQSMLSIYAQIAQDDAFLWQRSCISDVNRDPNDISNWQKLSQSAYTYLKSAYIARNAGISSVKNYPVVKSNEQAANIIQSLNNKDKYIAKFLPIFLDASAKSNTDYTIYGFTPILEKIVKKDYDDSKLIGMVKNWTEDYKSVSISDADYIIKCYMQFLAKKSYTAETSSWGEPVKFYSILDINLDGIPELLIQSSVDKLFENDPRGVFHTTILYTYDLNKGKVVPVNSFNCGSKVEYSKSYKAIVSCYPTTYRSNSDYEFYSISGNNSYLLFSLHYYPFDRGSGKEIDELYKKSSASDKAKISKQEADTIVSTLSEIEFKDIPENDNRIKGSENSSSQASEQVRANNLAIDYFKKTFGIQNVKASVSNKDNQIYNGETCCLVKVEASEKEQQKVSAVFLVGIKSGDLYLKDEASGKIKKVVDGSVNN